MLAVAAAHYWNLRQHGFYAHEGTGERAFRWTRGNASVTVPLRAGRPAAVRLQVVRAVSRTTILKVTANGCTLYEGPVPRREWTETFPLGACAIAGDEMTIRLISGAERQARSRDRRRLGVAIRSLMLEADSRPGA